MNSTDDSSKNQGSLLYNALGSSTAGLFARFPVHPLDTCKAKLQVQQKYLQKGAQLALEQISNTDPHVQSKYLPKIRTIPWIGPIIAGQGTAIAIEMPFLNTRDTLKKTFAREGIVGLYRGFLVAVSASIPAMGLYFTTYEASRRELKKYGLFVDKPYIADFLSGIAGEAVSCVLFVPMDVIKERMQVQSNVEPRARYVNVRHAIRVMLQKEGAIGLFRAYGATLASFGPYSAISLALYERFKEIYCRTYDVDAKHMSALMMAALASCAGGIGGFVTNPLDTVKVRMQVQRGGIYHFGYHNIFHGLGKLLTQESKRSLFVGVGARVAFVMPNTAMNITLYETCTRWYKNHFSFEENIKT